MERISDIAPGVEVSQAPLEVYPMNASTLLEADEWQFIPQDEYSVIQSMEESAKEFGGYEGSIAKNGVQTGSNDVFLLDTETIERYNIEEEVVFPTVGGRDSTRWYTTKQDKYILYLTGEEALDEIPNTKQYLEDNRDELESRYCVKQGKKWFQLARHRPGLFDQKKVITPDICYYNNFFVDSEVCFYALNSTYVMFADNLQEEYLVGILNSDAVQFYMRRTAPQYGNDYLRYVTSYLEEIPIPDPDDADESLVETVLEKTKELKRISKRYQEAKSIVASPELVFEQENIERSSLSFAGYIKSMDISGEDAEISTNIDGTTVRLNVQDTIKFTNEDVAEGFATLIKILEIKTSRELEQLEVPSSKEELFGILEAFEVAKKRTEEDIETAIELEEELNKAVFELYCFNEEHQNLISERIDKPENPLEAKVR